MLSLQTSRTRSMAPLCFLLGMVVEVLTIITGIMVASINCTVLEVVSAFCLGVASVATLCMMVWVPH